jgi:hypothetical protein
MTDQHTPTNLLIEQWGIFELTLPGPASGNPYVEVDFGATFSYQQRAFSVAGFFDGAGSYRVRCMPDQPGEWRYQTHSRLPVLDAQVGGFTCTPASAGNHGPVRVTDTFHFAYADGSPHYSLGTTCYAWAHQGEALERQTLETLRRSPFNKLRMCVFPKHYAYNANEPALYPFARLPRGDWDFTRINPLYFQHFENLVGQLRTLGIEADLILFHPYDRWGFADMGPEANERYLRYLVARLAAYRNVWWSLANEYDLMGSIKMAEWDRYFQIIQECDPYQHPRSIHNCRAFYDHAKPWVTHCSIQHSQLDLVETWRQQYRKPVVVDECCYEGNIPRGWGNISARELVHRFWEATVRGGYAGHGETYLHPQDILWWSKGGELHGESPARLAFLRQVLEAGPPRGFDPVGERCARKTEDHYLWYFGVHQPARYRLDLPASKAYRAEWIDPWEMTITPVEGEFRGQCDIPLPGKPYQALRLQRLPGGQP